MKKYDAIIIGSGQAGTPLAKRLAKAGWKTALIEKRLIGGTCINDGCTPTKTMISSAKMAFQVNHSTEWGIKTNNLRVDFPAVMKRKNEVVDSFRGGAKKGLEKTKNLDIIIGDASFSDKKTLTVQLKSGKTDVYAADKIFINTGIAPVIPEIEGLTDLEYLTSTSILQLTELPEHLVIIGGSSIGLEFGQMFRRLGSRVTILEQSEKLLPHEDEDISAAILEIFREEQIDILIGTEVKMIAKKNKHVEVVLHLKNKEKKVTCSHVLLATGRKPETASLNLGLTGVKMDEKGYIAVNNQLETNVKGIYALGDVNGGPAFTHIAYNDFLIVMGNLLKKKKLTTDGRMVPYCIFIDPPLGRVGLTEVEARKLKLNINVAKLPMEHVGRAIENGETRGFMKAVVDADSKKILGVAILGAEGGETMSVLQMAMMGGITYDLIRNGIFAHPTYAESLNNLFMSLDDK